jgi:lactate 2-monooxygenase
MAFGDYQNEIYFHGLAGVVPKLPMIFAEPAGRVTSALSGPTVRLSSSGV